jgi:hypothetical protein
MRRTKRVYIRPVRTAAVAALIALSVAAMGFGLQAAGLRRTPQANVVAARAATWMLRYRFATSTLRLGGRLVHGQCFHGWIEGRRERPTRGTILVLDDGASVRAIDPNTLLSLGPRRLLPVSALELAGCTQVLGTRIAALAQFDSHVHLRRTSILGQPVFALHFQRLTLFVSAKTDRPLGVTLGGVASTIRLSPITPVAAHALGQTE